MKESTILQVKGSLVRELTQSGATKVGAGVSGGPDSMVLLTLLAEVCAQTGTQLFVLTVDHNMRSGTVSAEDSDSVLEYCGELSKKYNLSIIAEKKTIPAGQIKKIADERKKGSEEAARTARYSLFEEFAGKNNLSCFFLAHNQNDNLETLIQRFLQGSPITSSLGITERRDVFWRPLINVSKEQILDYAGQAQIPYRIDSTNLSCDYFRNRIRNKLFPVLDEFFPGWKTGVLHGAEKNRDFAAVMENLTKPYVWHKKDGCCFMDETCFDSCEPAVQLSLLYKVLQDCGCRNRVKYENLKNTVLDGKDFFQDGIKIFRKEGKICVIKNFYDKTAPDGFYYLAGTKSEVCFDDFLLRFSDTPQDGFFGPFPLPLVVRNSQSADKIKCADGKYKLISRIYSDWKVPPEKRKRIPVVEVSGIIVLIAGSCLDCKNWYVADSEFQKDAEMTYIKFEPLPDTQEDT